MQEWRGILVVIFVGDGKKMEKLMGDNPSLSSLFSANIQIEDFTNEEIFAALKMKIEELAAKSKSKYFPKHKYLRMVSRRIGMQRGEHFGNMNSIDKFIRLMEARQTTRITTQRKLGMNPDVSIFEREDILGPRISEFKSEAWDELKNQIGLQEVKHSVESLIQVLKTNEQREENEEPLQAVILNRVFMGNPGGHKMTMCLSMLLN
jgi:hypothetical protein